MNSKHIFGLLIFGLLLASAGWAQQEQKPEEKPAPAAGAAAAPATPQPAHGFKITAEDTARKNPVKFTTVSVERGKKIYDTQCAMCHGAKGDGKGDVAAEMKLTLPDMTKPETLDKRTDGDLFAIISSGAEAMPGQGTRMPDTRKWNLVNYLRAMSGKAPERSTGKEPEENVILVPQ